MYGGRGDMHTAFWWGNLSERDHLEDLGIKGILISKLIFSKWNGGGGGAWPGLVWANKREGGGVFGRKF